MLTQPVIQMLSLFLATLLLPLWSLAQDVTAFRGRVTDTSGAVMVGVSIVAKDEAKGLIYSTVSNEVGEYELRGILPATYTLTAEAMGFKKYENRGVIVYSQSPRRVDIAMEIGDSLITINVEEKGSRIETDTPSVTYKTPEKEVYYANTQASLIFAIDAAPGLMARNEVHGAYSTNIAASQDGILTLAYGTFRFPQETLQEVQLKTINVPAEYQHANNIIGVGRGGTNNFHGEIFNEFRHPRLNAKDRSLPARIRPETPEMRWSFEASGPLWIPRIYDGRNKSFFHFLYQPLSSSRVEASSNLSYPTLRMRTGDLSEVVQFVPPRLNPLTGQMEQFIANPFTGEPFPNNMIPEAMWHPMGRRFRDLMPDASGTCGPAGPCGIFFDNSRGLINNSISIERGTLFKENYQHYRFDHQIVESNTLSVSHFRYTREGTQSTTAAPLDCSSRTARDPTRAWSILNSHLFSPSVINEFSFGYNQQLYTFSEDCLGSDRLSLIDPQGMIDFGGRSTPISQSGAPVIRAATIGQVPAGFISGFPNSRRLTSARADPLGASFGSSSRTDANAIHIKNNVSITRGTHLLKVGFSHIHGLDHRDRPAERRYGQWDYTGAFTGWDFADILLGLPFRTSIASSRARLEARSTQFGIFFQDDWKITPRLTLNPGIRFQHYSPGRDANGQWYNFDLQNLLEGGPGRVVIPDGSEVFVNPAFPPEIPVVTASEAGFPDSLFNFKRILIDPRLGLAYRLTDKTVMRAGFGIYHVPLTAPDYLQQAIFGFHQGPFELVESFGPNQIVNGLPDLTSSNAFPAPGLGVVPLQNVNALRLDTRSEKWPYDTQWNLTFERELGSGFTGRLSYVGSKGTQWTYNVNLQTPPASTIPFTPARKQFGAAPYDRIMDYRLGGNQTYHGLEAELLRQFSSGLYVRSWIEFRSVLNDVSGGLFAWVGPGGFETEDPFDRSRDKSRSDYSVPLRARLLAVYTLPFGKGERFISDRGGFVNQLLGNWTLAPQLTLSAYDRFTPFFSPADPANVGSSFGRPDILPGCKPNGFGSNTEPPAIVWDTSCFAIPRNGTYGSATRGVLTAPREPIFNLNVFKVFPLTRYENGPYFKLEAYFENPFNHTNPEGPLSQTIGDPRFGAYRAGGHVRRVYFRFRIGF